MAPGHLPGSHEVIALAREKIEERRVRSAAGNPKNPFVNYYDANDSAGNSEFLQFALSEAVVETLCGYYGAVPQLKSIGLWLTRPMDEECIGSQLFHLDKPECGIVGLFLNVNDVTNENGPLTAIPADSTRRIVTSTRYAHRYFCSDGRLQDDEIARVTPDAEQVALKGPSGTGAFVDTSSCLHFGSRCKSGERMMLVLKYMRAHRARDRRTPEFDGYTGDMDDTRQLILSGARI